MVQVTGIVLAAGEGRRAGGVKALLTLGGQTFVERVVTAVRDAGCEPVTVVGGADAVRVETEAQRLGADFVLNEHWEKGQFTSLRAGVVSTLARDPHAVGTAALVALVDHPAVLPETYRTLVSTFRAAPDRIVIPVYEDGRTRKLTRGHPVVLPPEVLEEVAAAAEGATLRDIIHERAGLILEVRVEDQGVLKDIDTAADLDRAGGQNA